ncbi:MAG: hypothetical protein NVS1B7_1160 [Candidatus Saccharimonadales bacterium]
MKRFVKICLVTCLFVPTVIPAIAAATDSTLNKTTVNKSESTSSSPTQDSKIATNDTSENSDDKVLRLKRLESRKAESKIRLAPTEQQHLSAVCRDAQGKAAATKAKIKSLTVSRTENYVTIIRKLTELENNLHARLFDTSVLRSEIANLQSQVSTFNTDIASYKVAVDDVVIMDCMSDPTAFKVSLDVARSARDKSIQDSGSIKAYIVSTIRPTLEQIKDAMPPAATVGRRGN